jgi:hypothetical protein
MRLARVTRALDKKKRYSKAHFGASGKLFGKLFEGGQRKKKGSILNPKKTGNFEKKVYSVMGSQSKGHWGHFGQVEAWTKSEAKEKAKTIQDAWARTGAPPIKKIDLWPAGEVTARVKRRGNPGVIRFTEAEAKRYSAKIKGMPATSSGHRTPARKAPAKKRGPLAGLGRSVVRGLGMMQNGSRGLKRSKRRASKALKSFVYGKGNAKTLHRESTRVIGAQSRGRGRRKPNPLWRSFEPTMRGRRTPGHLEISYGKGRKARKRAAAKGIKGYFSGGLDRSVMRGSLIRQGKAKSKLPNPSPSSVFSEFRGKDATTKTTARAANGTPKVLAKLGQLREFRLRGKTVKFGGGASLAADGRKKLHVVGVQMKRPNPPGEVDYGEVLRVTYRADKPHIEEGTFDYVHKFGEEGGRRPHLIVDEEGFPKLEGGSYKIDEDGIID